MEWIRTWFKDMKARSWLIVLLIGTNLPYWLLPKVCRLSMLFVVFPFALILLTVQLVRREIRWNAYSINLFAMAAFYILAWVRNLNFAQLTLYHLIVSCVSMTIAGIVPRDYPERTLKAETLAFATVFLVLMTLLSVVGMASVYTGKQLPFLWKEAIGIQVEGKPASRLFLLMHPNSVSTMCAMTIMFIIYWLYNRPPRWLKVVFACALVPLTLTIIHCQSRSNNIALAAGVAALIFRALYLRGFRGKKRIWVVLAAGCIAFFCVLGLMNVVFKIDMNIASVFLKKEEVSNAVPRTITEGTFDTFSTGRDVIWRTGMRYLLKHPSKLLLGMGAGKTAPAIRAEFPEMLRVSHLHNEIVRAHV